MLVLYVVLALIGKHWLNSVDENGVRRLDKPNDWVRFELEEALGRQHIPVIPLLVQGARLPSENDFQHPSKRWPVGKYLS